MFVRLCYHLTQTHKVDALMHGHKNVAVAYNINMHHLNLPQHHCEPVPTSTLQCSACSSVHIFVLLHRQERSEDLAATS